MRQAIVRTRPSRGTPWAGPSRPAFRGAARLAGAALVCGLLAVGPAPLARGQATAPGGKAADAAGPAGTFQPSQAEVRDKLGHRFVWRERCGNNSADHQLGGGYEWEGDSRSFLALGEADVRGRRGRGLLMLAFPDGDTLEAAWKVAWPKGHTWRVQYALTDAAVAHSTNGLEFTVVATDAAGKDHTVIRRTLKPADGTVYDERVRFDFPVRTIRLRHDNLGKEVWDVLWILPDGLDVSVLKVPPPSRPLPDPAPDAPAGPDFQALRQAIEHLRDTFPARYRLAPEYLARLAGIEKPSPEAGGAEAADLARRFEALQREALVGNPLVSGRPVLYVVRHQHVAIYHAIDTLYEVGEATEGRYRPGAALKVLFAMRRARRENLHLFEIGTDGTGLRQLTFAPDVSDFDPIYLPDGDIVFCSTREPKYNMCSQDIGANLFRMGPGGENIHQITKSTLFENQPSLLPDGRVLYKRWEYVDRNFGDGHGFWAVNPDGTSQATVYGNNTADPAAVYYPRVIPDSGGRLLCILSTHHHNMWGPMAILDPGVAVDGKAAILRTWPGRVRERLSDSGRFDCDGLHPVKPKYETPWPLSDKHFLCARSTGQGTEMGLYLVDVFGNEVLLHAEPPGVFSPMPLAPRSRPPRVAARRDFLNAEGHFYVQNVYSGTHMEGVRPGSVKAIRIVESPEKRGWTPAKWYGQGFMAPGMNWHDFTAKRILGTVPVEADGSAYFSVPSDTFLFFQLLDAHGMMVQSMRSGTVAQSGEKTGCAGCHDDRLSAPPAGEPPRALRRAPSRIAPWHGPARSFSYLPEVQPILDRHCVRCHDFPPTGPGQAPMPGAKKLILAGDKGLFFNASYTQLWRKGYLAAVGAGPAHIRPAGSWGSHASKLVQVLRGGHNQVRLTAEELDRIVTWIDINAPYYPSYYSAYPNNLGGRCPLDDSQLRRLGQLTGLDLFRQGHFSQNTGPHVSFDRPELSPCLAGLAKDGPAYAEALAILHAGREMLAQRPRADMQGFRPSPADWAREQKYLRRRQREQQSRQALRAGDSLYDPR